MIPSECSWQKTFYKSNSEKLTSNPKIWIPIKVGDKKIPYRIETEIKGADLLAIRYEQLWSEAPLPLENPERRLPRNCR